MEQVLLVIQVILAVGLIGMVLIQRSDSDGFGLSGGSGNNLLSGRGTANAMTRITAVLATLFILNSLALSVIAARGHTSSIAETIEQQQSDMPAVPVEGEPKTSEKTVPSVPPADAAPVAPKKPNVKTKVMKEELDSNTAE